MPKIEWRPWLVLGAFALLQALITVAIYTALGIALPLMVHDEGWSWTEAGFGFTVIGACIGGSSYLPAILIRRFGVRVTLLFGTLMVAGGLAVLSVTHGLAPYFIGAGLCGIGYQMMALIPANHVLSALFRRRSSVLGLYFTLASAMSAAGPLAIVGLLNVMHNDWRRLWMIETVVALIIGTVCALVTGGPAWLAQASDSLDQKIAVENAKPQRLRRAHCTQETWTLAQAVRTPQFYVLLAAYFGHVICLATTASFAMAHLTQRGVTPLVVGAMLTVEALAGMALRLVAGVLGDLFDSRYLLIFALGSLVIGMMALSVAQGYPSLIVFAIGTGIGFTVTALAVMVLVVDYFGRAHNLEIFSTICLIGTLSSLGPTFGGVMRDHFGGFGSTFQLLAIINAAACLAAIFMRPPQRASATVAEPTVAPEARLGVDTMEMADLA
jgi:MFS family permease